MRLIKHVILRIKGLYAIVCIGAWVGLTTLGVDGSGPGDGFVLLLDVMLFYILGFIILLVESYYLHKKEEIKKRNANLKIVFIPLLFGLTLIILSSF